MERLLKSEFVIGLENEKFKEQMCLLKIDYENKSYEIIPPSMRIETNSNYPLLVAGLIREAYEKAMLELYPE